MKGFIQLYVGDGKGKTSAALGLIMRAVGAGLRVCLVQFMKRRPSSELRVLRRRFPEVAIARFGTRRFVGTMPRSADINAARKGLCALRRALRSARYDVVVADEIATAIAFGLLAVKDVIAVMQQRPPNVELVLTGIKAPRSLISHADLVTRMRKCKHYFDAGITARRGIEF